MWWLEHPEVASQWSPRNEYTLEEVSRGSDRRPWWRCSVGHEWQTTVLSRVALRTGCPFCSGRRVTPETSLRTRRPDLAAEWDYATNPGTPDDVTWRSPKSVAWTCGFGHKWAAPVANRSNAGTGCPFCAGKMPTPTNCLEALYPEIARDWHESNPISAREVLPKTHKKYLWRCPKGHEYKTSVASRTHLRTGCPLCGWQTSKLELRIYHELKVLIPTRWHDRSLGFEIDVFFPDHRIGLEVDGWYWHRDAVVRDRAKSAAMEAAGVRPLRVRGAPLPLIGLDDFQYPKNHDQHVVVDRVVRVLRRMTGEPLPYDPTVWLNDSQYEQSLRDHVVT